MSYEEEKQDRKIEQLETEIERLRADAEKWECEFPCSEERWCNRQNLCIRMKNLDGTVVNQAARIKELEDALVEKQTQLMPTAPSCYAEARRRAAINQLQAEGKIGPDAETGNRDHVVGPDQMVPNGKVWQITEERKAAIDRGLQFLEWSYAKNSAHDTKEQIAVLWAMLEEDTHGKP